MSDTLTIIRIGLDGAIKVEVLDYLPAAIARTWLSKPGNVERRFNLIFATHDLAVYREAPEKL